MPDRGDDPGQPRPPSASLVQAVLDNLDEGFLLVDRNDRLCLWNAAFLAMLELPAELFTPGADVMPIIRVLADRGDYGPGDPAALAKRIASNISGRIAAEGERKMVNGRIVMAQWMPVPDDHFLFRLRNVTAERTASRFKDELIATVSHELRTPLTAIIGALGLLKVSAEGSMAATPAAGLIDIAAKNGERLKRLVNDLLDVDKLQSGVLDFQFEPTDVTDLLRSSVEQNLPYSQSLGVVIDLEAPDRPVVADIDRSRIQQVMSNLLSNAAKFSPAGQSVRVRLSPAAQTVRISVIDTGRGMSPEFCRRLFTRFAQENRDAPHGQAGTGLGLAICKTIIDRHCGEIHVDTREGVGTIFHVDLPYRQRADGDCEAEGEVANEGPPTVS